MSRRVTITAAAGRLGVNKSTISRWVAKHPALRDEDGLVDPDELRAHRDQVVDPRLQTRGAAASQARGTSSTGASGVASLNDARQRTERAKAEMSELDLVLRLGHTLNRADVETALVAAAETLKAEAMQVVKEQAERLATIDDSRAMEVALREIMTDLMEAMAQALNRAAEADCVSNGG